jgi:hypothetical protein
MRDVPSIQDKVLAAGAHGTAAVVFVAVLLLLVIWANTYDIEDSVTGPPGVMPLTTEQ